MSALLVHEIPGAAAWSLRLRAGRLLRLTALGAGANVSTLLYGPAGDRLNIPDTLKSQMSARIAAPMVLMSDRGIGLASVVGSTVDWHDAITGHSLDSHADRFGPSSYATDRNDWRRSARFGLLAELRKNGLGPADMHACINFFSKVAISDDDRGSLAFVPGHTQPGDWVTLRAEQDLLLVLSTAPHPLDPQWTPVTVRAEVLAGSAYGADDPSMTFRPESARALAAARAVSA